MSSNTEQIIPRKLGEGLLLRQATVEDTNQLAEFNARIHGHEEPNEYIGNWTRDLMSGNHPTFRLEDFTLVEDTSSGKIVSSLNLISQTWRYGGIEFGVGRPEIVGTDPDYRRRGLVREQFKVVHAWSAQRGELMLGITGIPNFYRQFGYEMALELEGGREGHAHKVPELKEDESEPYLVRAAIPEDVPFIANVCDESSRRYLLTCCRSKEQWEYELTGRSAKSANRLEVRVIEDIEHHPVGFLVHAPDIWGERIGVATYELGAGTSWGAVTPTVVRYLLQIGKEYAERDQKDVSDRFAFWLGSSHPVYEVIPGWLPQIHRPYAWYIRIPDLPAFLRRIGPVLEERLANSALVGHNGELTLNFYRGGIHLRFEKGRLAGVDPWHAEPRKWGDTAFPGLTFIQLVVGYRSLEELNNAFPDCWVENEEKRLLLNILFPKQSSFVQWPIS